MPHKGGRPLKKLNDILPALKPSKSELFTLRSATKGDIPYLTRLSQPSRLHTKAEMGTYYDSDFWHYIITVFSPESVTNYHDAHHHTTIVVDAKSSKWASRSRRL